MSGGRAGGGRPRLVRVALFGLFRFCHPLRHDVLCSTWMGPGDRRYELRWIPSSPRSKGKPSFRILKIDFACLPPHPPSARQGQVSGYYTWISFGTGVSRGMQRDSPMFINGASGPEMDLPSRISGSAHFVCFVVPGHVPVPTTRCAVPITRSDNCLCNCNGFRTRNNDSCQKRSSLGVGAIGGCAQQRCRLVCVPWHGTRCAVRLLRSYKMYKWCRSSHAQDILFPIWSCALVMQFVFRDARYA